MFVCARVFVCVCIFVCLCYPVFAVKSATIAVSAVASRRAIADPFLAAVFSLVTSSVASFLTATPSVAPSLHVIPNSTFSFYHDWALHDLLRKNVWMMEWLESDSIRDQDLLAYTMAKRP